MLYAASLLCGVLFGLGLLVSGMVNPAKVLNFLDVTGQWDPTLALVFIGALGAALPLFQWTLRHRDQPVLDDAFDLPESTAITPSLVTGAALFGVGWGIAGFCPGPGITALATLMPGALAFVVAMFAGMAVHRILVAD